MIIKDDKIIEGYRINKLVPINPSKTQIEHYKT